LGSEIGGDEAAHVIARRAADSGAGAIIMIDLARVGTGQGLDAGLIDVLRQATPGRTLLAGGGVAGPEDLARLADAGCDGVLVATALHDGRIRASHVAEALRSPGVRRGRREPGPGA
jgi:phosphoribosylformimino-5-aminoimidazole carboxamide ribotide isomerase